MGTFFPLSFFPFFSPLLYYSLLKGLKAKLFISRWLFKHNASVLLLKCYWSEDKAMDWKARGKKPLLKELETGVFILKSLRCSVVKLLYPGKDRVLCPLLGPNALSHKDEVWVQSKTLHLNSSGQSSPGLLDLQETDGKQALG